ncbi:hypothetical protein ACQY0O_006981 [Thecaphora frezii]
MDARSSDDALPSAPPEPAGAPSPSQPHSPTRDDKQAEVRDLLASLNQRFLNAFRPQLENAFSALKLQNEDRDNLAQRMIKSCRETIGGDFEFIVSKLSQRGPDGLPDWLARRIFITPSQNQPDIIPANNPSHNRRPIIPDDELFQVYRTWCYSNEHFDFYSALTELLILGLQAVPTVSERVDEWKYATYAYSFASDLHGDVVQRFNDALSDYEAEFDPKAYFGRVIPIVQSSGTGKSRMVHEMRKVWPTLSVTLRKTAHNPGGGFPTQDVAAVRYFRELARGCDNDLITIAFLAAWFKVAAENIPDEPRTVQAIFDAKWDHSLADEVHTFVHNPARQSMFDMVASDAVLFVRDWRKNHSGNNVDSMVKQLLEQPLRQFAQRIASLEAVKRQTEEHGCKKPLVLIAFDECTLLSEFLPRYKLLHLRRCFHHIGTITDLPVSVWLLLLDTDSTISKHCSAEKDYKSLREHDSLRQFPPFYAIGFDVLQHKAKAPRPRDALKLDTLKYYGRPLWHGYNDEKLIDVPYTKLGGSAAKKEPGNKKKAELSEALAVSLLSNRICLDLLPLRSDQDGGMVVTTTVERQMRIIVDFDETGRIDTRALSEPMLAIAAWYWLSDDLSYPRSWPNVIKYMRDHLLHSESVDRKGVNGEMLVQLLYILARDSTDEVCKVRELPWLYNPPDMPAIPFQSFLSALLGESASKLVLHELQQLDTEAKAKDALSQEHVNKRKRTSADTDVAEEEGQCWVNFTHVTPIVHTAPQITSCFLWEAWKRGAAIQCARGQARIDGILPIYRGSLDDAFNNKGEAARRMTYMAWQVKNEDEGTKSTKCMHGPLIAHPAKETEEPMFTLLLELGTETAFQQDAMISEAHPKISVSSFECIQPSCCSRSKLQLVRVRGCEAKVYPCLEHWKVGREFGDMVRRVSDRPISKGKTLFDRTLIYEVDDDVLEEPA